MSEPASVGSSSRRSGGAARSQRAMPTIASASPSVPLQPLSKRSIVLREVRRRPRSGTRSPGPAGNGKKHSHTSWQHHAGDDEPADDRRGRCARRAARSGSRGRARRTAGSTSSPTTGRACRRRSSRPRTAAPRTGNRNPVSVISGPVRLSGRRCQAISPQAMNEPPTERLTTATAVTSASPRKRKNSAANSAAIPSGQSTSGSRCHHNGAPFAHPPSLRPRSSRCQKAGVYVTSGAGSELDPHRPPDRLRAPADVRRRDGQRRLDASSARPASPRGAPWRGRRSRRRRRWVVVSVRVKVASVRRLSLSLRAVARLTTSLARTLQRRAQRTVGRIKPPFPVLGRLSDGSGPSVGGGPGPAGGAGGGSDRHRGGGGALAAAEVLDPDHGVEGPGGAVGEVRRRRRGGAVHRPVAVEVPVVAGDRRVRVRDRRRVEGDALGRRRVGVAHAERAGRQRVGRRRRGP